MYDPQEEKEESCHGCRQVKADHDDEACGTFRPYTKQDQFDDRADIEYERKYDR